MNRGFINAEQARFGFSSNLVVLNEISAIENTIMLFANNGYREVIVDNTELTRNLIPAVTNIDSIDVNTDTFTAPEHGLMTGNTIYFFNGDVLPSPLVANREYSVVVIDEDNFRVLASVTDGNNVLDITDEGSGVTSFRKVIESEKYYRAWKEFYLYPFATSFTSVLTRIEEHFRRHGYRIERRANETTKTIFWKITW